MKLITIATLGIFISTASAAKSADFFDGAGEDGKAVMQEARARIEKIRKGDFKVRLEGPDGSPLAGRADVQLLRHEFQWGGLLMGAGFEAPADSPSRVQALKVVEELFSTAGVANSWKATQPTRRGPMQWKMTDDMVAWANARGMDLRTHCLIYNFYPSIPAWYDTVKTTEEWWPLIENRIRTVAERYGNAIGEYNVINEMLMNRAWAAANNPKFPRLSDPAVGARIFQIARKYLPHATLVTLEAPYATMNASNTFFKEVFDYDAALLKLGAPVDVIGFQGHYFATGDMPFQVGNSKGGPGAFTMKSIGEGLDHLATLGKPIHITEFHPPSRSSKRDDPQPRLSPEETAAWAANYLTLVFSKPYIEQLIYYNIIDGTAGRAIDGGLVTKAGKLKLTYYAVRKLLKDEWNTHWQGEPAGGAIALRGFFGRYVVQVDGYEPATFWLRAKGEREIIVRLAPRKKAP